MVTFYSEEKKTTERLESMLKTGRGEGDRLIVIRCFASIQLRLTIRRPRQQEQEATLRTVEWWQKLAEQLIDELDKERIIQRGIAHGYLKST